MMSASARRCRHVGQGNGFAMHKLVRQGHGPFHGAIRHDEVFDTLFIQMTGHQINGVARANQQCRMFAEIREDLFGQADSGKRHRDRAGANGGVGPDLFGHGEGMLEQAVEQVPNGARLTGGVIGILNLAEDLRFAQHQ